MDQEAEIMKQSMARQEAAQQAAPQEEDEQAGPLRTASSGARGMCLKHLRVLNTLDPVSWCMRLGMYTGSQELLHLCALPCYAWCGLCVHHACQVCECCQHRYTKQNFECAVIN